MSSRQNVTSRPPQVMLTPPTATPETCMAVILELKFNIDFPYLDFLCLKYFHDGIGESKSDTFGLKKLCFIDLQ